jgi:charged multivesicular body protein 2A
MNISAVQKIMMEFEKESDLMEMKEEMISDSLDEMNEDDEEEEDELVGQILDEIGLKQNNDLDIKNKKINEEKKEEDDDVLSKRLESLKKDN